MEIHKTSSWEQAKARELVAAIDEYSSGMAQGGKTDAIYLLATMIPDYPDTTPKIRLKEIELARLIAAHEITDSEALAIATANHYLGAFNRNFGFGTNASEVIGWDDPEFPAFFKELGATLQAILKHQPHAQDNEDLAEHLAKTNSHYYRLLNLAEEKLTQPASPAVQR